MKFKIGDFVKKNANQWEESDFGSWGRGIGIGQVVDPPFELGEDEVDVRWPTGRCFEKTAGLLLVDPAEDGNERG